MGVALNEEVAADETPPPAIGAPRSKPARGLEGFSPSLAPATPRSEAGRAAVPLAAGPGVEEASRVSGSVDFSVERTVESGAVVDGTVAFSVTSGSDLCWDATAAAAATGTAAAAAAGAAADEVDSAAGVASVAGAASAAGAEAATASVDSAGAV